MSVAAKFLMHAKVKYRELYLISTLGLMYVKKFTNFCQVLKKDSCTRKLVTFFSVSRVVEIEH